MAPGNRKSAGRGRAGVYSAGLALLILLVLAPGALADGKPAMSIAPDPANIREISGEVRDVREFKGELLMVLIEWRMIITITSDTKFSSDDNFIVSRRTAGEMLPGKAVTMRYRLNNQNEVIAESIKVLSYKDLLKIREERPERMAPITVKGKDAKPQKRNRKHSK